MEKWSEINKPQINKVFNKILAHKKQCKYWDNRQGIIEKLEACISGHREVQTSGEFGFTLATLAHCCLLKSLCGVQLPWGLGWCLGCEDWSRWKCGRQLQKRQNLRKHAAEEMVNNTEFSDLENQKGIFQKKLLETGFKQKLTFVSLLGVLLFKI